MTCHALEEPADDFRRPGHPIGNAANRPSYKNGQLTDIIDAIAERLEVPKDRVFVNLDKYGNTSAAAVAIALDEANRNGLLKSGDHVLLVAFGAGLTWASAVIEW